MKIFNNLILIILIAFSLLSSQTKDGFRGYKWGTPISKMQDVFELSLFNKDIPKSNIDYEGYITNIDTINRIPVTVIFGFYNGKFCDVNIRTTKMYSILFFSMCTDLYGKLYDVLTPGTATWTPNNSKRLGSDTRVTLFHEVENPQLNIRCISIHILIDKVYEKESEKNRIRIEKEF